MKSFHVKDLVSSTVVLLATVFLTIGILVYADPVTTEVIVGNAAPVVSAVVLNSSAAITLTENTTKAVKATVTVTDGNGCETLVSIVADFYRATVGASSCDAGGEADNNNCYPAVSCTEVGNSCTDGSDTAGDYECDVDIEFYADNTTAGTHIATDWEVTITADDGTATHTGTDNQELNSLPALSVTAAIDYDTLSAGNDSGSTNQTITVTNTGNIDMDPELSGTVLDSSGDEIAIGNQEYSDAAFTWGAGTDLSGTPTQIDITLPQGTSGTVPITDDIEWGLGVDGGQPSGSYTGTNTVGAAAGL